MERRLLEACKNYKLVQYTQNLYTQFSFSIFQIQSQLIYFWEVDPNQFDWKSYINYLQNYNMPPSSQNSQNRPLFFCLLFYHHHYQIILCQTLKPLLPLILKVRKNFIQFKQTILWWFQMITLVRNFHNFLPKLG